MREVRSRRAQLRAVIAVGAAGALAAGGLAMLGGTPGTASSHREAPQILGDPQADNTDTYAFRSPDKKDTVTLLASWYPFQEPNGGPNFYPFAENARYNIHVDNSGDGVPDVTYRWEFRNVDKRDDTFLYNNGPVKKLKNDTLLFKQRYTLTEVKGDEEKVLIDNAIAAPSFTGKASMPKYGKLQNQGTRDFDKGKGKAYAGAADDSFFLDLRVFDLLYGGDKEDPLKFTGQDTLKGYNVNTLAVQVPRDAVALEGDAKDNPVIGVWSTTERLSTKITDTDEADTADTGDDSSAEQEKDSDESNDSGGPICIGGIIGCETRGGTDQLREGKRKATVETEWVQVSRLGHPLINEVIASAPLKDTFNSLEPSQDGGVQPLVDRVLDPEVPKLLNAIYGLKVPTGERTDLFQIFLTGIAKSTGPIKADLNAHILNEDAPEGDHIQPAEMLRLNMSTPVTKKKNVSTLGVLGEDLQGFPNGRRFGDDVVDIELLALVGAATKPNSKTVKALKAGDGVDENNRYFDKKFPYIAKPNEKGVNRY